MWGVISGATSVHVAPSVGNLVAVNEKFSSLPTLKSSRIPESEAFETPHNRLVHWISVPIQQCAPALVLLWRALLSC